MKLTDLAVKQLGPGVYMDDKTPDFGIRVGKARRSWIVVQGRGRIKTTFGHYPNLSLADARAEAKKLLAAPSNKPTSITFKDARDEFLADHYEETRWKHIVTLSMKKHLKRLNHEQVADITDLDVSAILGKLTDRPSAQLHTYRVLRTFFNWCTKPPRRYIKISPMYGYEPPGKDKQGSRILTDGELKAVWKAAHDGSKVIFRLLILWGTRNEETTVLERMWNVGNVLTIPGAHTKNGRDHSIPLLPMALAVLAERSNNGPYYFPGRYAFDTKLNPSSLNRMKREIQADSGTSNWQIRDIRRTFRSNMSRLRVPRELSEVLINHAPPVLDAIYDKYDRIDEKREALAKYEEFIQALLA